VDRFQVAGDRHGGTGGRQGRILVMMDHPRAAGRPFLPTSPFGASALIPPAEQFAVHDQVTHDKYGLGRVISVEDDTILIIDSVRAGCRSRRHASS
jgi:hypothetical protein